MAMDSSWGAFDRWERDHSRVVPYFAGRGVGYGGGSRKWGIIGPVSIQRCCSDTGSIVHNSRLLLEDACSDLEGCLQEFPVLLETFQGTPIQALDKPVAAQGVCCRVMCVFSHNI